MTNQYKQSMAKQQQLYISNHLSETATDKHIAKMKPEVKKLHRQKVATAFAFEDAVVSGGAMKNAGRFFKEVDELTTYPMNTILEDDESRTTDSNRLPTREEVRKIKKAINIMQYHGSLLASRSKIEDSFHRRLMDIHTIFHMFICTKVGHTPRPGWGQLCRLDREVNDHVARVAHAQQQLKSDVAHLRSFLRDQLFDEYCLMRGTPMEMKNETWMRYGRYLVSEHEIGDGEIGDRLNRMIDASGLHRRWVMDHIEDYRTGNGHIGAWQRLVRSRRWKDLALKLTRDIRQLEMINRAGSLSNGRECRIMRNIQSTKGQFFARLDSHEDFELSKKATDMDDESSGSSSSSSSSASATSMREDRRETKQS